LEFENEQTIWIDVVDNHSSGVSRCCNHHGLFGITEMIRLFLYLVLGGLLGWGGISVIDEPLQFLAIMLIVIFIEALAHSRMT